jgi:hypothetical protein
MRKMHKRYKKQIHRHIPLCRTNIWTMCMLIAGLMNGRAALLWQGKAGGIPLIDYSFIPQNSCQRRAAL